MHLKALIRYGLLGLLFTFVAGLGLIWNRLNALESQYVLAEKTRTLEMSIQRLYAEGAQMTVSARTLIIDPTNDRAPKNHENSSKFTQESLTEANQLVDSLGLKESVGKSLENVGKSREIMLEKQKYQMGLALGGKIPEASDFMKKEENIIWRKFREDLVNARAEVSKLADEREREAVKQAKTQKTILVALSMALILITVGIYTKAMGLLAILNKNIEGLRDSAEVASQSSETLSKTSETLSSGSSQQAAALQQTAASLEEISQIVSKNSDHAASLEKMSSVSEEASRNGHSAVLKMIGSIQEISRSNDEIVREIRASNQEIEDIVRIITDIGAKTKMINDIVFQTKLLSFNASVEAARAGESGKGFAVVAEEVGNLAVMSGNSAQEISKLLAESTTRVQAIVAATQSKIDRMVRTGQEKVSEGIQTAEYCGKVLDEVVQNVSESGRMVKDIANASTEQTTGVQEITQAMRELDQYAHKNASASQETSEAARKMREQSESLQSLLNRVIVTVHGNSDKKAA